MILCDKCRCHGVCGVSDTYERHLRYAQDAYDTCDPRFMVTVRCNSYIPERKEASRNAGSKRNYTDRRKRA